MSTLAVPRSLPADSLPPLANGDRMTQPEFHRRYKHYPEDIKFELVGGIVYMASPLRVPHGKYHFKLAQLFGTYQDATPGVEGADNATAILGEESEPQPDLSLWIEAAYGGQAVVNAEGYLEGPPELIAEISHSSRSIDLHQKRTDYETAGVLEYVVVCVEERVVRWFALPTGKELRPNREGVLRSRVFPGLWLDPAALVALDGKRLTAVLQQGLADRAHAAFVKRLERARCRKPRNGEP